MRRDVILRSFLLAFLLAFGRSNAAFAAEPAAPAGGIELREMPDRVEISIDGKPFSAYYVASTQAKPYFHPLRSPSGKIITRGWPIVTDIPGESHDHPHHRGAWFTHGEVNQVDFWAEGKPKAEGKPTKGRQVHRRFEQVESGATKGRFIDNIDWVTPDGKTILNEVRDVTIHSQPQARILDFVITLRATNEPVVFGDTKEGSFAIRLVDPLNEKSTGKIRNSEGSVGEKQAWGQRARWVDYSGAVDGESLGVAIFDHPTSFRHPTYWHVRGYGLFAANAFGVRDFTRDKQQDGSATLKSGQPMIFRYRVYIHSGEMTPEQVEAQYKAYASSKPSPAKGKPSTSGK